MLNSKLFILCFGFAAIISCKPAGNGSSTKAAKVEVKEDDLSSESDESSESDKISDGDNEGIKQSQKGSCHISALCWWKDYSSSIVLNQNAHREGAKSDCPGKTAALRAEIEGFCLKDLQAKKPNIIIRKSDIRYRWETEEAEWIPPHKPLE